MGALADRWQRLDKGQLIKWTVYSLLLLNWVYYAAEEFMIASHTLRQGGTFWQWTEEFATTIDELGWFGLLFMFELETYSLDDKAFERWWVKWGVHGVRLACYLMLAHTVIARVNAVQDTLAAPPATGVTSLCELADGQTSWGYNYRYELLSEDNCNGFTEDTDFIMLEPSVVTDTDGWARERQNTWVDLSDAITWLLVVWSIELAVWLQNRNITGGRLMLASHAAKFFYFVLFCHMTWWAWIGHWVYAWDQFLWIAGFWAIENNVSEWRREIEEEQGRPVPA